MAGSPELINRLRPILPELRYLVTDLAALPDEEILAKIINHSPLAALTAFFLKRGRDSALVEKIAVFAIPLRRLLTRPSGHEELGLLIRYLERFRDAPALGAVVDAMARSGGDEVAEDFVRYSDLMRNQGRAEGIQQGVQQGILRGVEQGVRQGESQGKLQALRDCLLVVLRARFGDVPESVDSRISTGEPGQLRAWLMLAAKATNAETAFAAIASLPQGES